MTLNMSCQLAYLSEYIKDTDYVTMIIQKSHAQDVRCRFFIPTVTFITFIFSLFFSPVKSNLNTMGNSSTQDFAVS